MVGRAIAILVVTIFLAFPGQAPGSVRVHRDGIDICAIIIKEMTNGRVGIEQGRRLSLAIANAGNKHFGRVTCADMWLYMAIAHIESGFRVKVVNHLNCRGIFQVHAPSWARKFGIKYSDLLKPEINAHTGIGVFKYYLGLYKHLTPTLSAYNSDHPRAAGRYAGAVLNTRKKIAKRYREIYYASRKALAEQEFPPL